VLPSAAPDVTTVRRAVEARFDNARAVLAELVMEPSVLGAEAGAQGVVERWMRSIGFSVRSVVPDAERLAAAPESGLPLLPYDGRRSLVGELPGAGAGVVVLNGHVDVVSAAPEEQWRFRPFDAVEKDGRLYGRGAADMKGGAVAMLLAIEAARSLGPLASTVVYQSVIEEESTGNGTLAAGWAGPAPDAALIAEPTDGLVYVAAVGVIWARVTVSGDAGHALSVDGQSNPVDTAYEVIAALRCLEQKLNDERDPELADVERPYLLNVGALHAGDWPSTTPGKAELDIRLGIPRSMEPRIAQERVAAAVAAVAPGAIVEFRGLRAHGYAFDPESHFVRLLRDCHEELHGAPPGVAAARATNDLRFFARPFEVPGAAVYGPAGGGIHGVDEWVDLASIVDVATVIALVLRRWRGVR
jgi:acetylornithine deacetylase